MAGRFRARRYEPENAAASLDRRPVAAHPLQDTGAATATAVPRHSIQFAVSREEDEFAVAEPVFDDPLRADSSSKDLDTSPAMPIKSKASRLGNSKDVLEEAAADWDAYKLALSQRFGSSGTITISSIIARDYKASATSTHLQQLEDPEKRSFDDFQSLTQECVTRLKELNEEIAQAWRNDERVSALRLTIKVAKLLTNTSVPQFYPTLFILVTDVMDNVGDLVWNRIKNKAESDSIDLPVNFSWIDVPQDARETCNNWFLKVATIKELLPRIYLEIAILRCLQFLESDLASTFRRLSLMIRGLANPLVSAYAYVYLSRKGLALVPHETGYLVDGIHDFSMLLYKTMSDDLGRKLSKLQIQKQTYLALMEPMFDWVLHCIFKLLNQEEVQNILVSLCGKRGKNATKPLSVLVNYLLKQLPATFVGNHAIEIARLVKSSSDVSMSQSACFITLGRKLCDCPPPREFRIQVLNDVWKTITKYTSLADYVAVARAFVEYILQCCSEAELILVLRDLKQHFSNGNLDYSVMVSLEPIAVAVINHYADFNHVYFLDAFVDILDLFHGDSRLSVSKAILISLSRNNKSIPDPVCKNFLFECARVLHDSLDSFSSDADLRQISRLVVRFIQLMDYSHNREQHMEFLVDCRATFPKMDSVRVSPLQWSSHALNLLKSGILCLQDLEDSNSEEELRPLLMKFCSLLVTMPGDPELGVLYFLRGLVNLLDTKPWLIKGRGRLQILVGILLTVSTLSQDELPYHVADELGYGNDVLYFGEAGYQEEMQSFSAMVLERIGSVIKQEKNTLQRGFMLLDTCNAILIAYENATELGSEMLKKAETILPKGQRYLEGSQQFSQVRLASG